MEQKSVEAEYNFCPKCAAPNPNVGVIPFKCGRCGFAQFFGPVTAVGGLIVNLQRELLWVRRARNPGKGKWGLPGGFVDRGETAEDALVREVLEETGLVVRSLDFLLTFPNQYNYKGTVSPVIDLFFTCQVEAGVTIELAVEELDHFQWSRPTPAHLEAMAFDSNRRAVEHWMATVVR